MSQAFLFNNFAVSQVQNKFNIGHAFILQHPKSYLFLKKLHEQRVNEFYIKPKLTPITDFALFPVRQAKSHRPPYVIKELNTWCHDAANWWNEIVEKGCHPKMKQLIIVGPSDIGKTSFVHDHILSMLKIYFKKE